MDTFAAKDAYVPPRPVSNAGPISMGSFSSSSNNSTALNETVGGRSRQSSNATSTGYGSAYKSSSAASSGFTAKSNNSYGSGYGGQSGGGGGGTGSCSTCGCDEYAENAFKPGQCRSCFHPH
jgi:hypothetical protein